MSVDISRLTDAMVEATKERIAREIAPLLRRIEALETEVRIGHERIQALEAARHD